MKCPKCQSDIVDEARFCSQCGTPLEKLCPRCNTLNKVASRFCDACGHSLAFPSLSAVGHLSFDETIARLQKYLPEGITEKVLSQWNRIEGEKKLITVMFCDMKGFTPLVDQLGPEEAFVVMNEVYEILIHRVHDYQGTVNQMTGDGIMALFGAPIALEYAPQRAIRSAMAIHREIARYEEKIQKERCDLPPIRMRIGIHTGPVVVGIMGNDLRLEFKAVGDTVNLTARMEELAEPGTTCVSEDTFRLTEGYFRFEALGHREIRGKEKPLRVYRVLAPSTRRTRFDVSAETGLTPFVGRQRELDLLLRNYRQVREGHGQAVSIVSEAGLGKSRLLYEFRKAVTNEDVTFLEGKCIYYGRNMAYHPVVDVLRANFDIQDMDDDAAIRAKVIRFLRALDIEEASTKPYLLELLSVKDSGIGRIPMSPEARKERTLEALKRITLRGAERRPVIMAIEDLHWVDRSSEDALKEILESITGSRVFLIFTYRPEFAHTWGNRPHHNPVVLKRLSHRESLDMIGHVFASRNIDRNLEELILEKTEGTPFFIEEFVKSLIDLKLVERRNGDVVIARNIRAASAPSTIQEVIMARVDNLPEGARDLLKTGSAIEREFSYDLIRRLTHLPENEILSFLSTLKKLELLYERGVHPDSTFIFKHALTREIVYDSILIRQKKALHQRIGNTIEELYKDNLNEYYDVLAEHFFISEDYEKSAEYSRRAGRQCERAALFYDAVAHAKKRVRALEQMPRTDASEKQIIDARTLLGLYMAQMHHLTEAKKTIDPIIAPVVRQDNKKRLCQLYTILATYSYVVEENYPEAFRLFEEALDISAQAKDVISTVLASTWYGVALGWNCDFEKALVSHQRALDINLAAKNPSGIAIMKSNLGWSGYFYAGKMDLAYQTTLEAARLAEEIGDIFSKPMPYTEHGESCFGKGFFGEAEKYLLMGVEACEKINVYTYNLLGRLALGELYFELGDYSRSREQYEKSSSLCDRMQCVASLSNLGKAGMARSDAIKKDNDVDLESLYRYARKNRVKAVEGRIRRYIGEILLNIDESHFPEAEQWILAAVEADRKNRLLFCTGQDHALYADWHRKKGDVRGARDQLIRAIDIYRECGSDGWVEKAQKALAELA